jgi:hypothetical protein
LRAAHADEQQKLKKLISEGEHGFEQLTRKLESQAQVKEAAS